ncbi:MAG: C-GCAxxG-C-C family protein [Desulfosarcinaceae bacterium]|nr:C-GCAxxG-C-C family protein [Desulfosarcinaceae bacterium]
MRSKKLNKLKVIGTSRPPAASITKALDSDPLVEHIHNRTANLFRTQQLWCSEAVLCVLNRGLGGELPNDLVVPLGAGFGEGIGGSGCTCGALSGGAMAIGLFCGAAGTGLHRSRNARTLSRQLHDHFKAQYGSTCCRILTKQVLRGSDGHFELCTELAAGAAALTATLILSIQPERRDRADWHYLRQEDSRVKARLKIVGDFLKR